MRSFHPRRRRVSLLLLKGAEGDVSPLFGGVGDIKVRAKRGELDFLCWAVEELDHCGGGMTRSPLFKIFKTRIAPKVRDHVRDTRTLFEQTQGTSERDQTEA